MAKSDAQVANAQKGASVNQGRDAAEKKIESDRIALKIPTPSDYNTQAKRDALYRLNKQNATKNMSASELAAEQQKASPFGYKKGGRVKRTGIALVHKGEKVLTKKQQSKRASKGPRKRA